ncbi:MAG: 3-phosphoshikimate 1-carboxyvinyltransferase [Brumimicrobium sp.]|nr:3-phosphoshikimate 1-carboxyvinyltransferase [Brumimicrobium sp.]
MNIGNFANMTASGKIMPIKGVEGRLNVPSSKSYAQRAVALSSLVQATVLLRNVSECDDVIAAQGIIRSLGAKIENRGRDLLIKAGINFDYVGEKSVFSGESGLSARLFSAFSLLYDIPFKIDGQGSIRTRTMEMVTDALTQFGKSVESKENCLPLKISGNTSPPAGEIELDGTLSSQFLTGLLIVTPFLPFDTVLRVRDLKSVPYVEMTLDILTEFGITVHHENFEIFKIPGNQKALRKEYRVEGDWSGASFLISAAAIGGNLRLSGLNKHSKQADIAILTALSKAGGSFSWEEEDLIVHQGTLKSFRFDATHCPDLFPPLAVLAACADGVSVITGISRLKHKESDRSLTIKEEFGKLGIEVRLTGDEMHVKGNSSDKFISGGNVHARGDHRIAMALAVLSLRSKGIIHIANAEAVDKSYPDFYKDLDTLSVY